MSRVIAHHEDHASSTDDLTIFTDTFDTGADFHGFINVYERLAIGPKHLNINRDRRSVQGPSGEYLF